MSEKYEIYESVRGNGPPAPR